MKKSTTLILLSLIAYLSFLFAEGSNLQMYHLECILLSCTYFIVKQLEENKS